MDFASGEFDSSAAERPSANRRRNLGDLAHAEIETP
jgi:hypothetical protein